MIDLEYMFELIDNLHYTYLNDGVDNVYGGGGERLYDDSGSHLYTEKERIFQ